MPAVEDWSLTPLLLDTQNGFLRVCSLWKLFSLPNRFVGFSVDFSMIFKECQVFIGPGESG